MKLHIKSKLFSLHDKMEVLDEDDQLVYEVKSKAISLHDKTHITDADGEDVAYIHAKVISVHNVYYAEMNDGFSFEVSEELFHLTKDVINIEALGWQVRGDITAHEYEIVTEDNRIIATAHRKWLSLHHIYYLDIADEDEKELAVTLFVILEHLISKRGAVSTTTNVASQND